MNAPLQSTPRVEPIAFDAAPGARSGLYHAPNPQVPPRGAILHVHPFADELNRTRHMAGLQARAFAAMGYAVLQFDLFGCGDSCGEFSAARWALWKSDLAAAAHWLSGRAGGPLHLWGVRLGGLLALDFARQTEVDTVVLWQPFMSGQVCINEFLRQHLVAQSDGATPRSTAGLRAELAAHGRIEAGGYQLALALVEAIDACDADSLRLPPCTLRWFANPGPAPQRTAAGIARLTRRWAQEGVALHFHPVDGPRSWKADAMIDCPSLLGVTSAVFAESQG